MSANCPKTGRSASVCLDATHVTCPDLRKLPVEPDPITQAFETSRAKAEQSSPEPFEVTEWDPVKTEFVRFTYTATIAVNTKANWFGGRMPRNLIELAQEVGMRKAHGHDVTEKLERVALLGDFEAGPTLLTGQELVQQQDAHWQNTAEGNWD